MPTFSQDDYNEILQQTLQNNDFLRKPVDVVKVILDCEYLDTDGKPPYQKYLDLENAREFVTAPLTTIQVNLLAKCESAQDDPEFYQNILLNDSFKKYDDFDEKLLVKLAQNAGFSKFLLMDSTRVDQFKKILAHPLVSGGAGKIIDGPTAAANIIDAIVENERSEGTFTRWRFGLREEIFKKLGKTGEPNDIAKSLKSDTLAKLASRSDSFFISKEQSLKEIKLILATVQAKKNAGESIEGYSDVMESILKNKNFTGDYWFRPNLWRRYATSGGISDASITPSEQLLLIPYINDKVLLKRMAKTLVPPTVLKDDEAAPLAKEIINNDNCDEGIAEVILRNKKLVNELDADTLTKLAEKATTPEHFKTILEAKNAGRATADAVIERARVQNTDTTMRMGAVGLGLQRMGRSMLLSFKKGWKSVVSPIKKFFGFQPSKARDQENVTLEAILPNIFKSKWLNQLSNDSLKTLNVTLNNAERSKRDSKYKLWIQQVIGSTNERIANGIREQQEKDAARAAVAASKKTALGPGLEEEKATPQFTVKTKAGAELSSVVMNDLKGWYQKKSPDDQKLMTLGTSGVNFPPKTEAKDRVKQAKLFIESLEEMVSVSKTGELPLKLDATGFDKETRAAIFKELSKATVKNIELNFDIIDPGQDATLKEFNDRNARTVAPVPKATMPKATAPKVTTPKATAPKVTTPKPTAPKVTTPKPTAPKVTTPKPTAPKVTTPKPTAPKVTTPKPTAPKVTTPKPTAPKVTTPKPTAPKVTTPKPTAPKVPKPTAKPTAVPKPTAPTHSLLDIPGVTVLASAFPTVPTGGALKVTAPTHSLLDIPGVTVLASAFPTVPTGEALKVTAPSPTKPAAPTATSPAATHSPSLKK